MTMAEYIKREAAENIFSRARMMLKPQDYKSADEFNTRDLMLLNAEQAIHMIPTADVKPVVHGEWIEKEVFDASGDAVMLQSAVCNKCNRYHTTPYSYYFDNYNFCPHCGADMRGGQNG